jgi:hypothetical protein
MDGFLNILAFDSPSLLCAFSRTLCNGTPRRQDREGKLGARTFLGCSCFSFFAPHFFANPSSYSRMGSEGRKMVAGKMKSTRNRQLLWDAT